MLKILAVLGWIFLILIALVLWVVIIPRSFFVQYTEKNGLEVKVRIFAFKIKIYPIPSVFKKSEKTKSSPKTKQAAETKKEKAKQPSALKSFMEDMPSGLELVKEVLAAVKGVAAILLKGIYIKDVSFTVPIYSIDAYETQKQYGIITNSFYTFNIFLQKYVNIFYKKPVFIADFANLYSESTYFYCKVQASPIIILSAGWFLVKTYLRITKNKKDNKFDKEI